MASAQVKSCLLLAGLSAEGETIVREPVSPAAHRGDAGPVRGRDHRRGRRRHPCGAAATKRPATLRDRRPGDPSQAAFWLVAGAIVPGSDMTLDRVYVGPGRRGFLDVLHPDGADIDEAGRDGTGRPGATATLRSGRGPLRATAVEAAEITGLDEVPVLAVAAACAEGTTVFRGVGELRVKESDRLVAVVASSTPSGRTAEVEGDDLIVDGTASLSAGDFDAGGDHRMAMAAAVAAAAVALGDLRRRPSPSIDHPGFESVTTSYPGSPSTWPVDGDAVTKVVAIDGPAGAGKSTSAQAVADHLGVERLDTGAMYRAVAWQALESGIDPDDADAVGEMARRMEIEVGDRVVVDGTDVTDAIRTVVSTGPCRRWPPTPRCGPPWSTGNGSGWPRRGAGVVEGRDIGTVVLPDADLKIYLTARTGERARRRAEERGDGRSVAEIETDLERRDRLDSTRSVSPLVCPRTWPTTPWSSTRRASRADDVLQEVLRCL